jgi:hypothetical protein
MDDAPKLEFPAIDTSRVAAEFGFRARSVLDDLPQLVRARSAGHTGT